MNKPLVHCAVIGNPISHSLSPKIHRAFARQIGVNLKYSKVKLEQPQLSQFIQEFFSQGGLGLNVTAPFKADVIECISKLSKAADVCQSVNTVFKNSAGELVGDSTDGPGIIMDLKRLTYLSKRPSQLKKMRIVIIGAGGASIPVALSLLCEGCDLTVLNRTESKVTNIVKRLAAFGSISAFDDSSDEPLDGIISATSVFNKVLFGRAIKRLKPDGFVYDLNYAERAEELRSYCVRAGLTKVSDGYGMLLGQAAKSFEIWHGKLPAIEI